MSRYREWSLVFITDIAGTPSIGPRMASLSISPPTKLISLEEARARAQTTPSRPSTRHVRVTAVPTPERSESPVYRSSVEVPARRKTSDGAVSGRKWKSFFQKGRSFDASQSVAKIQETSQGTYVSVMREPQPRRATVERARQTRSAEKLDETSNDTGPRSVRARHIRMDAKHDTREIRTPVHQPVTISFSHQPTRERSRTAGEMHIRRHPVLTSFKRVSSEQTVFYTKVEYHPTRVNHRRASTGGEELESSMRRREVQSSEHRPVSVYDNRPISIYDNEPTTYRYSSPVFSQNYGTIPEEKHRYSTPVNMTTPPTKKSPRGRLSNQQIAITGARLAQASLVPCSNRGRPMHWMNDVNFLQSRAENVLIFTVTYQGPELTRAAWHFSSGLTL